MPARRLGGPPPARAPAGRHAPPAIRSSGCSAPGAARAVPCRQHLARARRAAQRTAASQRARRGNASGGSRRSFVLQVRRAATRNPPAQGLRRFLALARRPIPREACVLRGFTHGHAVGVKSASIPVIEPRRSAAPSTVVPVAACARALSMNSLRVQSLKLRLILQMLVILLPVTLLLAYQAWADLRRAEWVDHAFQLENRVKDARDSYHRFVNGVVDAVDTGRVARPALAELDEARRKLADMAPLEPTPDIAAMAAELEPVAQALGADPAIASALRLQPVIRAVDRRLEGWVNEYEHQEAETIVASVASAKRQNTIVIAASLF